MSDAELFTIGVRCALEWLEGRNVSPVRGLPSLSQGLIETERSRFVLKQGVHPE